MNCVMSVVRNANQEFRIQQKVCCEPNVFNGNRIHMVNDDSPADFLVENSKVAAVVANYYLIANEPPLPRVVERLILVSVESECIRANLAAELEILESLLKRGKKYQLGIASDFAHRFVLLTPV